MARDTAHLYKDILAELSFIAKATKGLTFKSYARDALVKRAVERSLLTISEAVRALPAAHTSTQPDIPWKQIKGIGNVLRHEYFRVADSIIWNTVQEHMPPLTIAIKAMAKLDAAPKRKTKSS